jgi:hypothetical protein
MDFDAQWCGPPHNEPTICGWFIQAIQMVILVQMAASLETTVPPHFRTPRPPPGFQNKALVLQYAGNATIRQVPIVLSSRYHGIPRGYPTSPTYPPSWPKKKGEDFLYVLLEENTAIAAMVWLLCVYHWVYEKWLYSFRIGILTDWCWILIFPDKIATWNGYTPCSNASKHHEVAYKYANHYQSYPNENS